MNHVIAMLFIFVVLGLASRRLGKLAYMLDAGFDAGVVDRVVSLVDRAEWKRRQFAPGPKISALAFGRDRRLPVTSRWREQDS